MKNLFLTLAFLFATPIHAQKTSLPDFLQKVENSIYTVYAIDENGKVFSQGSGFCIDTSGIFITNYHVLDGAYKGLIRHRNGKEFYIEKVLDYNHNTDLVKFTVITQNCSLQAAKISKSIPKKGENIVNIGNPLGLEQTVSTGIISAVREDNTHGKVLQITAPISHGSSGSPVFNSNGDVIGVATFCFEGGQNLNFAVSSLNILDLNKQKNIDVYEMGKNELETLNIKQAIKFSLSGDTQRALNRLDNELSANPQNHLAMIQKAQLMYNLNDIKNCYRLSLDACKLYENSDYLNLLGMACAATGYNKGGDEQSFELAYKAYTQALELDPLNAHVYYNIGRLIEEYVLTYNKIGVEALADAINMYSISLSINPSASAYTCRARCKARFNNDFGDAILDCNKAIEIEPEYYRAYFVKGDINALDIENYQGGLTDLNIALSLVSEKENKADILGIRGIVYWRMYLQTNDDLYAAKAIADYNEAYKLTNYQIYNDRIKEMSDYIKNKL